MPKGHNKDGSKKVRPVNSGRKAVESTQISPQISLQAAIVLASLKRSKKNLNKFISEAILEKAASDAIKLTATKKESTLETVKINTGQVDLVDIIQQIKIEKLNSSK